MRSGILFCLFTASLAAQSGSVEGKVVDQSTGKPLADVHVRLLLSQGPVLSQAYGVITRKSGRFRFPKLPPGLYNVNMDLAGMVAAPTTGVTSQGAFELKPRQRLTGLKWQMARRAVVAGRVLDANGDPVAGVQVEVRPVSPSRYTIVQYLSPMTDDRGMFTALAAPGRYYVYSQIRTLVPGFTQETRTDGSSNAGYLSTYYPNSPDLEHATVVEAAAGQERTGLDIHLVDAAVGPARHSISGTVSGLPDGVQAFVYLSIYSVQPQTGMLVSSGSSMRATTGAFAFDQLPPGTYRVAARYAQAGAQVSSNQLEVRLDGSDATDLRLILRPGEQLAGSVTYAGSVQPGASSPPLTVSLESLDRTFGAQSVPAQRVAQGQFHFADVFPGRYRVQVQRLPEDAYIQSITSNGTVLKDSMLDLSAGVNDANVQIAINLAGGELSGKVLGRDGVAATPGTAWVCFWRGPSDDQMEMQTNPEAGYVYHALKPGKYRVLAIPVVDYGSLVESADRATVRKSLMEQATEIEIQEGAHIVKDLKTVAKEAVHVAPAR